MASKQSDSQIAGILTRNNLRLLAPKGWDGQEPKIEISSVQKGAGNPYIVVTITWNHSIVQECYFYGDFTVYIEGREEPINLLAFV